MEFSTIIIVVLVAAVVWVVYKAVAGKTPVVEEAPYKVETPEETAVVVAGDSMVTDAIVETPAPKAKKAAKKPAAPKKPAARKPRAKKAE